jgi:uncharacterized protein (DUF1330 family)
MAAYVVMIREEMTDAQAFDTYAKAASATLANHALKPLAFYGPHEVKEGDDCDGVVILEFPDLEQANGWYHSPEYQEAMAHRLRGARYRVIMVDGV